MNRTDLAIEAHNEAFGSGVKIEKRRFGGVEITVVKIETDEAEKRLLKPKGKYVTIRAEGLMYDTDVYEDAVSAVAESIKELAPSLENVLVAGLGNREITPDALGSEVVERVFVTNHIKEQLRYDFIEKLGRVSAIAPGVIGTTGMETSEILRGIIAEKKPKLVIAVDAYAASDTDNISETIQVSDAGLVPGGGVGNRRSAINEDSMGVPVIAIGVPTVVDASILCDKLYERGELVVTPKDIDIVIDRTAKTIANGINRAVHSKLTVEEIESYVG